MRIVHFFDRRQKLPHFQRQLERAYTDIGRVMLQLPKDHAPATMVMALQKFAADSLRSALHAGMISQSEYDSVLHSMQGKLRQKV